MKRILYLLSFLLMLTTVSFAQEDEGDNTQRIQERMREYIQKRLNLSKAETDRFAPTYLEYFNELRKTNQQYKGDRLILQRKVADLQIRYRNEFSKIMGDKRGNDVFKYEREFIDIIKNMPKERIQDRNEKNLNKRSRGQLP